MKIGFIYNAPCNILDVLQNPHDDGGSYICYLAIQLAKMGHDVSIYSQNPSNTGAFNVRCRHINIKDQALILDPTILETDYNALIFVNAAPQFVAVIMSAIKISTPTYIWTEIPKDDPRNIGFNDMNITNTITGIICASEWQCNNILEAFPQLENKISSIEHAISPFFEDLFVSRNEFQKIKAKEPQIAFYSGPEDGQDILIDSLPDIIRSFKETQINIYAGIYNDLTQSDQDIPYPDNVKKFSGLSKVKMANQLRTQTILANPCTFARSSNVQVLEAIAAGLYPITTTVGALQEYTHDHGKMLNIEQLQNESLESFASEMLYICQTQLNNSAEFLEYCYNASKDINKKHTWRVRAREWTKLLQAKQH
jgi:glycosyltransferase involved in cell wall biosynthesis